MISVQMNCKKGAEAQQELLYLSGSPFKWSFTSKITLRMQPESRATRAVKGKRKVEENKNSNPEASNGVSGRNAELETSSREREEGKKGAVLLPRRFKV